MNRERMLQMADYLENHPENDGIFFSMKVGLGKFDAPVDGCGTVCCIAGLACQMFADKGIWGVSETRIETEIINHHEAEAALSSIPWFRVKTRAMEILDLLPCQASKLFTPYGVFHGYNLIEEPFTAKNAARVLRHMAETGVCLWEDILTDYNQPERRAL